MPDGYEIRGKKVRVYFRYKGELCREPIGNATPDNINRAQRLATIINLEIESGTFDYARHFPESERIKASSFGHYASMWLSIREADVAASTWRAERSKFNKHILPKWAGRQINSIDYLEIKLWTTEDLRDYSNKMIKELVYLVSSVFELYSREHRTALNPCKDINVKLPDDEDPDPFDRDEIKALMQLDTPYKQEQNGLAFALWDGCRLSEWTGLAWEDVIDLEQGIVRYERAKVIGQYKVTKTRRSTRQHRLMKPAREALQRQWKLTGHLPVMTVDVLQRDNKTVRKQRIRPVFRVVEDPEPAMRLSLKTFFQPYCEEAGVRYRPISNCRHTFISQMLTLGFVPMNWISDHVGHTTSAMIERRYGKWIEQDGPDIKNAVEKVLGL